MLAGTFDSYFLSCVVIVVAFDVEGWPSSMSLRENTRTLKQKTQFKRREVLFFFFK